MSVRSPNAKRTKVQRCLVAQAPLLRKFDLLHCLADEGCGSEHDNSCNERCHAGIRQDFIENSGHCFPRVTSPIRAERSLQHRGEKVKFLRIRPLNARKKMMLLTEG